MSRYVSLIFLLLIVVILPIPLLGESRVHPNILLTRDEELVLLGEEPFVVCSKNFCLIKIGQNSLHWHKVSQLIFKTLKHLEVAFF